MSPDPQSAAVRADLEADQAARRRAVDPERSVILQAPAGSGKTTVLIERLLVLLARADSPEEILAITFTRKAAAEMALRVARALQQPGALAQAVRARSAARGWRLLENPGRLRIQTLDSLNRSLALQMPLAARGGGTLQVLPQPQGAYRMAARRALLDAQTDDTLRPDVQRLFERMENDFRRCEALIAGMLEKRAHWLPYLVGDAAARLADRVRDSLQSVVEARLARARQLLPAALLAEGIELCRESARHLQRDAAAAAPWWQALAGLALTTEGGWRRRLDVRCGFPKEERALKQRGSEWLTAVATHRGALELFTELALLPDPALSADETDMLGVLARLLGLAVAELELVFGEWGRVDYAAIAAAARAALGSVDDPSDLALRLDSRIRHILVDEFQDTSLEQTQLLMLLTAGWAPADGRTLFVVGDPMQSIYGFREAEVGMFLDARTAGLGSVPLESLTLRRNFRSAPQLVSWTNGVFARSFPPVDDARTSSVAYSRSVAARSGAPHGAVHLHRVLPGDPAAEARRIAHLVRRLRATHAASSIAILVSARSHAAPIVAALEEQRIAVTGVDLVSLAQLGIVRDLTALTQALDHQADRSAWLAVLRAPWCGLTLQQISTLVGTERQVTVWQRMADEAVVATLPPDAGARVRRVRAALLMDDDSPLARRVEASWLLLGGPAACAQEADLRHARAFFDALAQWAQQPDWSGPQELTERLAHLYASHDAGTAGAVQIMTIHRAKGLEFDHVILPGLGRRRRGSERPLLQWLDLPRGTSGSDLLMVAVPPAAASAPSALGRYVSQLQRQREQNEATRLLYVAATRARLQLHLFGQLEEASAQRPEPRPAAGTLLERLWPAIKGQFPARAEESRQLALEFASTPGGSGNLRRLQSDWQLPPLPPVPALQVLPVAAYEPPEPQPAAGAALVDRAVCELLRALARRRRAPGRDDAALLEQLRVRLQELGCEPARLNAAALEGLEVLLACREDERLRWIFACLAEEPPGAQTPLALTGLFEGRLTSIQADVSFRAPDGTRWLIDIAPSPPDGADLAAAFAVRLRRNAQLANALEEGAARAAVYLPATRSFLSERAGE
ncbi:MAG TPA: UvrD-helicase domain-containing protein [Steroidobacteraceae bacterium]|nr:UvrD-helicase domain-containing protein [Steroidobacteraceae bacterium]